MRSRGQVSEVRGSRRQRDEVWNTGCRGKVGAVRRSRRWKDEGGRRRTES